MSEPFLAEVRMVGFNFAPRGWAFCDGQILPINQNQSLFSLMGTSYGGDGRTSFALPDLRGRTPIHVGTSNGGKSHARGNKGGEEKHTLDEAEMPQHDHALTATTNTANLVSPDGALMGQTPSGVGNLYRVPATGDQPDQTLNAGAIAKAGGGQGHENMQPFIVVNFCISLEGLFPSRN